MRISFIPYCLYSFALLAILISSSCVEEIQYDLPVGFDKSVVIEGKLAKSTNTSIEVKISQLFNNDGYTDFFG